MQQQQVVILVKLVNFLLEMLVNNVQHLHILQQDHVLVLHVAQGRKLIIIKQVVKLVLLVTFHQIMVLVNNVLLEQSLQVQVLLHVQFVVVVIHLQLLIEQIVHYVLVAHFLMVMVFVMFVLLMNILEMDNVHVKLVDLVLRLIQHKQVANLVNLEHFLMVMDYVKIVLRENFLLVLVLFNVILVVVDGNL